jgi:DNA-binding transcriptional LysR family regulator
VKQIEFLADPTAGEVRVGSTVIVASSFIATTVDHLSRQYPRITVHLLAAEAAMIYHALEERDVEVVIAGIFRLDGGRQFERGSPLRRSFRGCSRCAESMEPAPPHKTCRFDE